MRILVINVLISLLFPIDANASQPTNRIMEVLFVEGQTMEAGKTCRFVTVKVMAEGELVDEFRTNRKGKFEYYFEANTYYELVFEKEGYITKRIEVNTYTHKLKNEIQDFSFNIEMVQGSQERKVGEIYFSRDKKQVSYANL